MVRRISSGCVATSKPLTLALPEVGVSNPQSTRMVVDFPAPLGPRKPKISPLDTSRETWSTATKEPKVLTKSVIWTAIMWLVGLVRRRSPECERCTYECVRRERFSQLSCGLQGADGVDEGALQVGGA